MCVDAGANFVRVGLPAPEALDRKVLKAAEEKGRGTPTTQRVRRGLARVKAESGCGTIDCLVGCIAQDVVGLAIQGLVRAESLIGRQEGRLVGTGQLPSGTHWA